MALENTNILILILLVIGVLATIIYIKRQLDYAKIADKHADDISVFSGTKSPEGNRQEFSKQALLQLIEFAKKENPDFILGVHTGGRLLSVLLCEELNYSAEKCHFISTDMDPQREPFLLPSVFGVQLQSNVLVVDDVTRTGTTLEMIRRKFARETMTGLSKVRSLTFATLLVSTKSKKLPQGFFVPDWWAFYTDNQSQTLPWSSLSESVSAAFLLKHQRRDYNQRAVMIHQRLISDYDFALFCVKMALEENDRFEMLVQNSKLSDEWDRQNEVAFASLA